MVYMVITAVASIRSEASHRSEMINQLLFGELCEGTEKKGDFVKIKGRYDGYEGWCQRRQLVQLPGSDYPYVTRMSTALEDIVTVNNVALPLSPGSMCFVPDSGDALQVGNYHLQFALQRQADAVYPTKGDEIVHHARQFLGTPYLWGGRSRYGIDCSGLTQVAFKLAGLFLPRDSGPQSQQGEVVNLLQEAQPGDLAFFDNDEGRIIHVGILLCPTQILHASANCRIDAIDHLGIVHTEEGERTHQLRVIKRYF